MTLLWHVYFVETDSSVVQAAVQDLRDCGFDCWETSIGGPGVQQHSPLSVKEEVLEILNRYWDQPVTVAEQEDWRAVCLFVVVNSRSEACSTADVSRMDQRELDKASRSIDY